MIIIAIPFFCFGLFSVATVFIPRIRVKWGGSIVQTGLLSSLGFALASISSGLAFLIQDGPDTPLSPGHGMGRSLGCLHYIFGIFY